MALVYGLITISIIALLFVASPTHHDISNTSSEVQLPLGGSTGYPGGVASPDGRPVAQAPRTQSDFLTGGFAPKIRILRDFGLPIQPQWQPVSSIDEMVTIPGESTADRPEIITNSGADNNEMADFDLPDSPIDATPVWPIPYLSLNNQRSPGVMLPAVVKIPPPRWPTIRRKTDTGFVTALVTIDPRGRITWIVTEVYPANSVYPELFIEALERGRYTPQTVDGTPVTTVLEITCMFCYQCEPSLNVVSGNIQASLLR